MSLLQGSTINDQKLPTTVLPTPNKYAYQYALAKNILWCAISLLFVVFGLEAIFAAAHVGEEEYLKIDAVTGFTHLERKLITFRSEGFSQEMTNSAGLRDVEHHPGKPPNIIRIAVLGDSKTESFQVPLKDIFPKLIEQKLNKLWAKQKKLRRFEILNFGMSGYSTTQEYLQLLKDVLPYKPDIIVLAYHVLDSDENVRPTNLENQLPRPYFDFDNHGYLVCDWSSIDTWLASDTARIFHTFAWFRKNSRIWGVISKTVLNLSQDKTYISTLPLIGKPVSWLGSTLLRLFPQKHDANISLTRQAVLSKMPANIARQSSLPIIRYNNRLGAAQDFQLYFKAYKAHFELTLTILRALNKTCSQYGCQLVIAALPAPNNSIFYFRELNQLEQFAKQERFCFINLQRCFPGLCPGKASPYYLQFHFSKIGHQLAADVLSDVIIHQTLQRF